MVFNDLRCLVPAMKHVTCVGIMRIFTRIYIRILHVETSADPHFTPALYLSIYLTLSNIMTIV